MVKNFWVIERRLNGGSDYFQGVKDEMPFFYPDVLTAKQYDNKIDAVTERSDLGIVNGTEVTEHQIEMTSVDKSGNG